MTAQSLSSIVKERIPAIVIVLDNGIQGIEQWILSSSYFGNAHAAPSPYLALGRWSHADLVKALGFAFTRIADTPASFRQALSDAKASTGPSFITTVIKPHDLPAGLLS